MPQYMVAIDMGAHRARAVVLETTFRNAKLVSADTVELDPETDVAEMKWRKLRKVLPKHVDSVIANVNASGVSTRLMAFPFEDQRKVDAALSFELESQIPYDLGEIAIASVAAQKGRGRSSVIAAVTQREALAEQIRNMRAADLEPRSLVVSSGALADLVPADEDGPVAVLSVGETESHMAVVKDGLQFARTLRAGGINIDRSLAKCYHLDLDKAKQAKETEARILRAEDRDSDEARAVSNAVTDGAAALVRAFGATLKSLPAEHAPRKILLTGGSSRLTGLAEHISDRLGVPVELVDLHAALGDIACDLSLAPEYADAVALAIASMRRGGGVALNFRHGELAYHGDLQVYRGEMTRIGIGLAAVFLLAIAGSVLRFGLISAEEGQLDDGFGAASERIIGKEVRDPLRLLSILRGGGADADGFVLPTYSATHVFEMLSMSISAEMDVSFSELDIRVNGRPDDPDRINAKGEAGDFETADMVATKIEAHPCVTEAEIKDQHKLRNSSRVGFKLNARVTCPPGVKPTAEAVAEPEVR